MTIFILLMLGILAVLPQWPALSARLQQVTTPIPVFLPMLGNGQNSPSPSPTPSIPPPTHYPEGMVVVDHYSVDLFEQLPSSVVQAAAAIPMMFSDRSVGENISAGLTCLSYPMASAPDYCKRPHYDPAYDVDPAVVSWSGTYDRSNWTFEFRQGTWDQLTEGFIQELAPSYLNSKTVLTYQFSYLNVADNSTIADPQTGFFANTSRYADVYDLENWISAHPSKIFFFWTTSLARNIGTQVATDFNAEMRQYALDRFNSGKATILFDVADILSHTPNGQPCYDNRDGVPYCDVNGCENYPDDGINLPAICQEYTDNRDGGHLNTAGRIRIAKAYWVLMAQIAGWQQ
jgi:hypothetical protein